MISIIIGLSLLVIAFIALNAFVHSYDAKREKALTLALNGFMDQSALKSIGKLHDYSVIYRNRDGELNAYIAKATNDLEAQYLFVKETQESILRVKSVQKL